jgi:hypothetical protein
VTTIKIGKLYLWPDTADWDKKIICVTKFSTEKFGPNDIVNGYIYHYLDEPNNERFLWKDTAEREWVLIKENMRMFKWNSK